MLKALMDKKNISAYALAKKAGIPYSSLSDIISGKTDIQNISSGNLYKLATVLGVSMEQLFLGKDDDRVYYLHNEGREVIINAGRHRFSYQGPKNLAGFRNISSVSANVLYVDTWFYDESMQIYIEEDYIDLNDIMSGYEELLNVSYEVVIGQPGESRRQFLCENALLVSDNIAVIQSANGTSETVIEAVSLKRNRERMQIRLKDYTVLYSNMSRTMEKKAKEAVERNITLITAEIEERKHA